MPAIHINLFEGRIPKLSARNLPDYNAQIASNVKLVAGSLIPLRKAATVSSPTRPMPATTIYQARDDANAGWMTWQRDVDVVRAPLPAEVESRYYWSGDGEPRYGRFSDITNGGANDYPKLYFALGVPVPQTKPTVTPSGGVGSTTTRFYCYTYFSALGEESGPSPIAVEATGKLDGTWAVSGMDEIPTSSGTGSATYLSGVTTFTNGSSARHWLRAGDEVVISGSLVVVLSTPSASSFTVAGNFTGATAWARKAPWNTAGMKRRLYRTTGSLGTFQLVLDDVPTSYNDVLTDAQIMGDELISDGWVPPDANLQGFIVHSSGSIVAFAGTLIWMSVPYQPHAFVKAYSLGTEFEIVGIATFGSEIAVATKGTPYIASGVEPEAMSLQKVSGLYPCLSKRSVTGVGDGAIYSSLHGLIYVGAGGVRVFTEGFYTKDEWLEEGPSQMVCQFAYGRVFISSVNSAGSRRITVIDGQTLTSADVAAYDLYTDPATGILYLATATDIGEWDAPGAAPLTLAWKSKRFVSPVPLNMGAAKLDFDPAVDEALRQAILAEIAAVNAANAGLVASGNTFGAYNVKPFNGLGYSGSVLVAVPSDPPSNQIAFTLFSKGSPVFSRTVVSEKAFRLPAGYKSDEVEVQVSGQCRVDAIRIGDTMSALGTV